jgi:hypothetical protein
MDRSNRRLQPVGVCLICLLAVMALLAPPPATSQDRGRESPQRDPWSVYDGQEFYPPSCHQLSYFSGAQNPAEFNDDISGWPPGSFTNSTKTSLIGTILRHRIYQVLEDIRPVPQRAPALANEIGSKRILVERQPSEFCMIFEEEGPVGPNGVIFQIKPAYLTEIDGEQVLLTHDLVPGTGDLTIDGAWTFAHGAPDFLMTVLNDSIARSLKEILPAGCGTHPNKNGLDLENLRFVSAIWPISENSGGSNCEGEVRLTLGMRNHKLVVVDK